MLESARLFRTEEWMTLEKLLRDLTRAAFVRTEEMQIGTAVHKIIEHPERYRDGGYFTSSGPVLCEREVRQELPDRTLGPVVAVEQYQAGPWTFDLADIIAALPPRLTHELSGDTEIEGHTVACRADAMTGVDVWEFKTKVLDAKQCIQLASGRRTLRAKNSWGFSCDTYSRSLQWRIYCPVFGARRVRYLVLELRDHGGVYRVVGAHELPLYPYAALGGEIREAVRWVANLCEERGISP